jgi:hypothetical protein
MVIFERFYAEPAVALSSVCALKEFAALHQSFSSPFSLMALAVATSVGLGLLRTIKTVLFYKKQRHTRTEVINKQHSLKEDRRTASFWCLANLAAIIINIARYATLIAVGQPETTWLCYSTAVLYFPLYKPVILPFWAFLVILAEQMLIESVYKSLLCKPEKLMGWTVYAQVKTKSSKIRKLVDDLALMHPLDQNLLTRVLKLAARGFLSAWGLALLAQLPLFWVFILDYGFDFLQFAMWAMFGYLVSSSAILLAQQTTPLLEQLSNYLRKKCAFLSLRQRQQCTGPAGQLDHTKYELMKHGGRY